MRRTEREVNKNKIGRESGREVSEWRERDEEILIIMLFCFLCSIFKDHVVLFMVPWFLFAHVGC